MRQQIELKLILTAFLLIMLASPVFSQFNLVENNRTLITGSHLMMRTDGQYGYAATGYGFMITDLSDPTDPQELAHIPTAGICQNLSIYGNQLFICDSQNGLIAYDVTDRANPVLLSSIDPPGVLRSVLKNGNYLYGCADENGLMIFDISDPTDIELVDIIYIGGLAVKSAIYQNYLYIAIGNAGVQVYDITIARAPVWTNFNWNMTGGNVKSIGMFNNEGYLAVGDFYNGLHILNLQFPQVPTWTATIPQCAGDVCAATDTTGICSAPPQGFIYSFDLNGNMLDSLFTDMATSTVNYNGDYSYVCRSDSGYLIISTADLTDMQVTSDISEGGHVYNMDIYGDILYIADEEGGVCVMDISNRYNPWLIERLTEPLQAKDVLVLPDAPYLCVADFDSGLIVYDISDARHPEYVATELSLPDSGTNDLEYYDGYIYSANYNGFINVFNLNNPEEPDLIFTTSDSIKHVMELDLTDDGEYIFASCQDEGVLMFNIDSPDNLVLIDTLEGIENTMDLLVTSDMVYVCDMAKGLYSYNIENIFYIYKMDSVTNIEDVTGICKVDDNTILTCEWTNGVSLIDVTNPDDIEIIDDLDTPGYAFKATADDSVVYLGDRFDLMVLSLYGLGAGSHEGSIVPNSIILNPAYPNPFNAETTISFTLPAGQNAKLSVYNLQGELVEELADGYLQAGYHSSKFDGLELSSGVYFVRLQCGLESRISKVILLK